MKDKKSLRQEILLLRKSYRFKDSLHLTISLRLWHLIQDLNINTILAYYPLIGEVNLLWLYNNLLQNNYSLYFPLTGVNGSMEFYQCNDLQELTKSTILPIYEPKPSLIKQFKSTEPQNTIILVPSLALDQKGNRLGFGKGYYDRYLQNHPHLLSIAPQFKEFILTSILKDPWDKPVNIIVSEKEIKHLG